MNETKPLGKTAEALTDTFMELVMERGYNAVSYADLAKRLGIRTASIHYHFPAKSDLGMTVLHRYQDGAFSTLEPLTPGDAQSYRDAFDNMLIPVRSLAKMQSASCLVGVLGAEFASLPDGLKAGVSQFFETQQQYLTRLLSGGRDAGAFIFDGDAEAMAKVIASTLQGAILIKKSRGDVHYMDSILDSLKAIIMPG
ncbi:MAG: hypothetical protein COA85_04385 [Robiginitomaculum sp.]|nr:MAG: hypothetical protein COA85_04385 [Robiginitomaculum sp.]